MSAEAVTEAAVAALLADLVSIPSINPDFREAGEPETWFGEGNLGNFVADWLGGAGIDTEFETVEPGRRNVVARMASGRSQHMIWEGHLDTVQVSGMIVAPFTPEIRDGLLYGRGAADDKGCLAMFMLAMRALAHGPRPIDLTFLAAVDEETSFKGVAHHIARHPAYDCGIAGEPTELAIVSACKGAVRWSIDVQGRAAHASTPGRGVDAGSVAADLLATLRRAVAGHGRTHPLLGEATLTCTRLVAGEGLNTVPGRATLTFDYRFLPAQTGREAWQELATLVEGEASRLPAGCTVTVNPPFVDSASMEVPVDHAVVRRLQRACGRFGRSTEVTGVPFGSDASKLTRAGTPTIIFGPGSIDQAHTAAEFVSLAEVALAANVLVAAVSEAA